MALLGERADPDIHDIRVDGRPLPQPGEKRYLLLNKPPGYVTTCKDPHAEKTVLDLLKGVKERVFPVGRLDKDTSGLLILTNDGDFALRLTHPRYKVPKTYEAVVKGIVRRRVLQALQEGVILEEGKTSPAQVKILAVRENPPETLLRITLSEGRKRQIRRMMEAVGHPVKELARTRIGPVSLGDLQPGEWRDLSPREVWALLKSAKEDEE